jgi:hypothetical protein
MVMKQWQKRNSAEAVLMLQERRKREGVAAVKTGGGVSLL